MTRPVSFFRRVTILLELYRENWQGGNIYNTKVTKGKCYVLLFNNYWIDLRSDETFVQYFYPISISLCSIWARNLFATTFRMKVLQDLEIVKKLLNSFAHFNFQNLIFGAIRMLETQLGQIIQNCYTCKIKFENQITPTLEC